MRKLQILFVALAFATMPLLSTAQNKSGLPQPTVKVGQTAPDFKLTDQNGKDVRLSDFRGKKNVALAFYVFAFTGG